MQCYNGPSNTSGWPYNVFFFCVALYIILLMRFSFLRCEDIFKEVSTM